MFAVPVRWILAPVAAFAFTACHDAAGTRQPAGPPVERTVTAATLDSLPRLEVADGHLVCLADGQSPCPVDLATANWVHDDRFATWEPNRQVQIWSPNQPNPLTIGEVGAAIGQYRAVVSVAANGPGYFVIDAASNNLLLFDGKGHYQSSVPVAPSGMTHATGFAGDIPLLQLILPTAADSPAVFEVRELEGPGDTLGRSVLKLPLPWLRIRDGKPARELPLFPVLPSYAIAADSDVVWSAGDLFSVRRQSASGPLRWSLSSTVTGPAVTPDEIKLDRAQLGPTPDAAVSARFDSSVALTAKVHAAITGLVLAHDGRVLVVGAQTPARDSIDFFSLSNSGEPKGRFTLPRRSRVLLFNGDSLLVQRPGANMNQELRWLILRPGGAAPAP
ncbi:MAG TPA: hypothetical protein VID74_07600 [Gemmatimonadales bacterium]|jgi:hypothetical protein